MVDWSNWAGTVHASPSETVMVRDVAHLQLLCEESSLEGRRVKAVGAGHSFTGIAEPTDILLRMDQLSGVMSADAVTGRVWVQAGTPLHVLGPELYRRGLAMTNLGDIDRQTIAGAISTGTHGTGMGFAGLSGQIRGVEMVTSDGSLLRITDDQSPEMLPAVSLGLGALGILTAVEIQCVPKFLLCAQESPDTLHSVLESLDQRVDGSDHFEFYWFPHTDRVLTKTNTRNDDESLRSPLPGWRSRLDDDLLSNKLFDGVNRLTARAPRLIPKVNQLSSRALSARSYVDWSYKVFASARDVRFRESEYAVPREAVPALLRELSRWMQSSTERIAFPVEVRFAAADDRWLSTAYGRETGYIAIHQYHQRDHSAYFNAFWSMLSDHEARPHWGKLHDLAADDLRERYPNFDEFVALRNRLDPRRIFTNAYLDQVLGA
ncbi:D-arabinono-1,4-lactone oxidase [Leekyejoonella antrihumi]|uniref:FAD-binding protein n=1 Tax=Leekyejoonella antrihumi TaxID=1660198 RepID=A0A563E4V3_9MICO|nr:D-arabinono-1,4-lactone oxidase [Leekyejoonella antrihumi]TWP37319.1 FAD-binding protein [Leekyejoonella antrihumi]